MKILKILNAFKFPITVVVLVIIVGIFWPDSNETNNSVKDPTATEVQLVSQRTLNKMLLAVNDSLYQVLKKNDEKLTMYAMMSVNVVPIYLKEIKTDTIVIVTRDTVSKTISFVSNIDQKIKWLRLKSDIVSSFHYGNNFEFDNFKSSLQNIFITEDPVELNLVVSTTSQGIKVARLDYDRSRFSNIKLDIHQLNENKRFSLGMGMVANIDESYRTNVMPSVFFKYKDFNSYIGKSYNSLYLNSTFRLKKHYDVNLEYSNKFIATRLIYVLF